MNSLQADAVESQPAGPGFGRSRRFLSALSDARLVERVRRGNELAFEVLYDRYSARILSFSRHMLGSREEAEDAVQHTFMAAYREITEGDREINLKPWLYTIARNRSISILRARHEQPAEELEPATAGLSEEVEQRADLRALLRDLRDLPVDQRAALLLAELGDLSHADIASVVGCPPPKVKALVFQARSNLAQRRDARETPCREIRQDIATLRGRAVRRGVIRRHLSTCPGCAAFWEDTRRQRERLSLVLPVVPTLAMKENALAATGLTAGSGGGGSGLAGLLTGGLASRGATVAVFAGGTLLAAGAAVTGIGVATDSPESKPRTAAEARERGGGEARGSAEASERTLVTAERTTPAPERRAATRGEGRRGKGGKGSPPRGVVIEAPPGTPIGSAPEQAPAVQGGGGQGSDPPGTPRRTRTRRHGGGPSPNANPQAGPPKSPDHPTPPNGGNNGGGRGGGKGPKPPR